MSETQKSKSSTLQLIALVGVAIASALGWLPAEATSLLPLLLMNVDVSSAAPAAAPEPGGAASPAAPAAAPAAGGSPAADGGVSDKPDTRSKGARAAERAAARLATPNNPTAKSAQQAPASDPAGGVSTDQDGAAGKTADPAGTTADGKNKAADLAAAASASTVTVPADWPKEDVERMNKLPDEGKQIVLDIQKRMAAGLTHAMTKLSEEKTGLKDVVAIRDQFQTDPKAAIAELARRANLEIFFERPGPEEEIPADVMNDPKKFADYIAKKATRDAQKVFTSEIEKQQTKHQTAEATAQLQREFTDAAGAHTDFAEHRPAVVALLQKAPALTVEEAYRLTTYEALGKLASEGEKAKRELAALKADQTRLAKAATAPPTGGSAPGAATATDKNLSRGELAYRKASSRLAANGQRSVST